MYVSIFMKEIFNMTYYYYYYFKNGKYMIDLIKSKLNPLLLVR